METIGNVCADIIKQAFKDRGNIIRPRDITNKPYSIFIRKNYGSHVACHNLPIFLSSCCARSAWLLALLAFFTCAILDFLISAFPTSERSAMLSLLPEARTRDAMVASFFLLMDLATAFCGLLDALFRPLAAAAVGPFVFCLELWTFFFREPADFLAAPIFILP